MKTMLVTGGCGFIGTNFIKYMHDTYPCLDIINLDKLTYAGRNNLDLDRYKFVHGDICDVMLVEKLMKRVDTVVHFAAETHVDRSIQDPDLFLKTNILGTHTLLRAASERNIKRFIHVSTDEVYGSTDLKAFTEDAGIRPSSPYSASKAAADALCTAYHKTYDVPVIVTRCTNNYGPYQHPEKFIPKTITNILRDKKAIVYGSGNNVRDWLYVQDHCTAIRTVLEHGEPGETYNIGNNGEDIHNIDAVKIILRLMGKPMSMIQHVKDRPGHDYRYAVNTKKIRSLGWQPTHKFETGIRETIQWYTDNPWWWTLSKS